MQQERAGGIEGGHGKRRQRVRSRKGYRLHKISNRDPIFRAGVPDARSESCFGCCLHAAEVTRHIASARVDSQKVCRSPHDDAEGPIGAGPLGQVADMLECSDTESLVQAASHGRDVLLRNHEVLPLHGRIMAASKGGGMWNGVRERRDEPAYCRG